MDVNMESNNLVYLNDQFVPEPDACVSVFDRGFLYGDGVFETMRAYGGKIFRLGEHIERLFRSADIMGLLMHKTHGQFIELCNQLLERNGLQDALLRISVTRGLSAGGIGIARQQKETIVGFVRPPMPLPADAYEQGVSAKIVSIRRTPSSSVDSRAKSMNYLNLILGRAEAESTGAYDAIMLTQSGHISETSTANIFFAAGDRLLTPSHECDILPGITRSTVIELAAEMDIKCAERPIEPSEIQSFSECFLTNSGVELLPVTRIDEKSLGSGGPGRTYKRLHQAYRELVQNGT
jgi:branched-chain amino acid aminotransferase